MGGSLNAIQESMIQFPIVRNGKEFDTFFAQRRKKADEEYVYRRDLYGVDAVRAFRCVQSFAFAEEVAALGVQSGRELEQDYTHHTLNRLHTLSVIDKHRRLPVLAWFPDILFWQGGTQEQQESYEWRPAQTQLSEFVDRVTLGSFVNPSDSNPPDSKLTYVLRLTF